MPQKITLDDGTEQEVYTQEELEAKAAEVEAAKQAEIDRIAAENAQKEEELKKFRDKDYNFENLRKKAEGKGETDEEIKKRMDEMNARLEQIAQQPVLDVKAEFIKNHLGTDKEKTDLFEYYYKRLGTDAKTKEEVLKAATEAMQLVTGGSFKVNESQFFSTGVNPNYRSQGTGAVSEESKEIAKNLGISEEDRKKYGKKN